MKRRRHRRRHQKSIDKKYLEKIWRKSHGDIIRLFKVHSSAWTAKRMPLWRRRAGNMSFPLSRKKAVNIDSASLVLKNYPSNEALQYQTQLGGKTKPTCVELLILFRGGERLEIDVIGNDLRKKLQSKSIDSFHVVSSFFNYFNVFLLRLYDFRLHTQQFLR